MVLGKTFFTAAKSEENLITESREADTGMIEDRRKIGKKKKSTPSLSEIIPQNEWDFSKCTDEQLEECKVYEICRRSEYWRWVIDSLKGIEVESYAIEDTTWRRVLEFLQLFPEFPATPWLSIPEGERKSRLAAILRITPPVEEESFRAIETQIDEARLLHNRDCILDSNLPAEGEGEEFDIIRASAEDEEYLRGPFWPDGKEILAQYQATNPYLFCEFVGFRINWRYSAKELCEAFADWIDKRRESKGGDHSLSRKILRDTLKALGAATLARHPLVSECYTVAELLVQTRPFMRDAMGNAFSLYASVQSWNRAISQLDRHLKALEPPSLSFECHRSVAVLLGEQNAECIKIEEVAGNYFVTFSNDLQSDRL